MTPAAKRSISDRAVQARTGKTWAEWFSILDAAGASAMRHPEIASYLGREHGVDGWWGQTVAVEYEQARGLRQKHQKADGFAVSVSKTMPVPVERLFDAWSDEERRNQWLGEAVAVRKATPGKSLRITWPHGQTSVDVNLYPKGNARSQVSVQHSKLAGPEQVEELRSFWKAALDRLARRLAQG